MQQRWLPQIWILMSLLLTQAWGQAPPEGRLLKKIRITVLRSDDWKGERHLKGVTQALESSYAPGGSDLLARIEKRDLAYGDDEDGKRKLIALIKNQDADIVLGPTDSGVFTALHKKPELLSEHRVPIISSLVTADVDNEAEGWMFRTNVNNHRRINRILDMLRTFWITNITLLHADTGFGRQAKKAFEDDLTNTETEHYREIQYQPDLPKQREAVMQLLETRPEVVGIIGTVGDIEKIYREIRSASRANPYAPLLFTIVDMGPSREQVDNMYFVSLTDPSDKRPAGEAGASAAEPSPEEESHPVFQDEVASLAYDTTLLVLSKLRQTATEPFDPVRFRGVFSNSMRVGFSRQGPLTGMDFTGYENSADPAVFHLEDGKITRFPGLGFLEWLPYKLLLVEGRAGPWGWINVFILVLIVAAMSLLDLKKWYEGRFLKLLLHPTCWLFVIVKAIVVIALWLWMGERGLIRYEATGNALMVAISYSAILHATLVPLPGGTSIGVGPLYDKLLLWVQKRLMKAKHFLLSPKINVIAYYNSLQKMKGQLQRLYEQAQTPELRDSLDQDLDERLKDVKAGLPLALVLERRRIAARRLLRWMSWHELCAEEFVPDELRAWPVDLERYIRRAAAYCQSGERPHLLHSVVKEEMEQATGEDEHLRETLTKELGEEIKELKVADRALVKVRFLVLRFRYTPKMLKASGLLEPEYAPSVFYPGSKLKRWWLARRPGGSRPSQQSPIEGKASPIVVARAEPT